jgi:hypothetical protein
MAFVEGDRKRLCQLHMQSSTLLVLLKQFNESAADEVICKIASWENANANGPFLTVEVSPRFVPEKPQPLPHGVLAYLACWFKEDDIGKYMTIQLLAKYQWPEHRDDSPFFTFH